MRSRFAAPTLVALGLCLRLGIQPASAQLPGASPAALGTANNHTALAEGYGAIGLNPARLAMPGSPAFSLSILPVQLRGGAGPISFGDIRPFQDRMVPDERREGWLRAIERAGGQSGGGGAFVTPLAMTYGSVGFQLSSVALAEMSLNPAAAELVLFGNAGRTGSARDFNLEDSSLHGFAMTTAAVAWAMPVTRLSRYHPDRSVAVGATLKYSIGHALLLGRDGGSVLESDPLVGTIRFPLLQSDSVMNARSTNRGSGIGLDVGVAWQEGRFAMGAALQNVFQSFAWNESRFFVRSGDAVLSGGTFDADFSLMPIADAPESLLAELRRMNFSPTATLGTAWRASPTLAFTSDARRHFGDAMLMGPRTHLGVGLEWEPSPRTPLRTGVAVISGGAQVGGGAGLDFGRIQLLTSAILRTVHERRETFLSFGVALTLR